MPTNDPIETRMEQLEDYYRSFMNKSARGAYGPEYGMSLLNTAAIMTLADAIEYLANSHHDYVLAQLFNAMGIERDDKEETDV